MDKTAGYIHFFQEVIEKPFAEKISKANINCTFPGRFGTALGILKVFTRASKSGPAGQNAAIVA